MKIEVAHVSKWRWKPNGGENQFTDDVIFKFEVSSAKNSLLNLVEAQLTLVEIIK
jgi:hypothetical protein